eukprot:1329892-Prymnesium_polylepis.1
MRPGAVSDATRALRCLWHEMWIDRPRPCVDRSRPWTTRPRSSTQRAISWGIYPHHQSGHSRP